MCVCVCVCVCVYVPACMHEYINMSSLSICFVSLCPSFVLTSLSLYACQFFPFPSSLSPFLSHYSTSFLSPVKITSNRTSSASVSSSISSRGSSPGLEPFITKVTPDEMSDGEFIIVIINYVAISRSLSLSPSLLLYFLLL